MNSISLAVATMLYNVSEICVVGLSTYWFYRSRSWNRYVTGFVAVAAIGLFLAVLLSLFPFDPLRAARLLCFGWFLHVPIYLCLVALAPSLKGIRSVSWTLVLLAIVVVIYSFWFEPFNLEVTYFKLQSNKVSRAFRVGVLADFQTDQFGTYEKQSLARFLAEKPDLILIPGDILQANTREVWESIRDQMNEYLQEQGFSAPMGVYAVGGNTDFQNRWPEIFDGLDVRCMKSKSSFGSNGIFVTGLSVDDSFNVSLSIPQQPGFHIALGHAPDFSLSANVDADLLVAGHTHGGQVRLPLIGPIVTFSKVPRSWASGLTQIDGKRTLVVSRGVGMERRDAPRMRFLCRPQLVFIDVEPSKAESN